MGFTGTKNHIFLLYWTSNRARMTLGDVNLPLTSPSIRNLFFLLHGMFNRQVVSSFSAFFTCSLSFCPNGFPTIYVSCYGVTIFENKIHIGYVIEAMSISTNPLMIPGNHHYCLGSLAPASTMVKLRLQRAATKFYSPPREEKNHITLHFNDFNSIKSYIRDILMMHGINLKVLSSIEKLHYFKL